MRVRVRVSERISECRTKTVLQGSRRPGGERKNYLRKVEWTGGPVQDLLSPQLCVSDLVSCRVYPCAPPKDLSSHGRD